MQDWAQTVLANLLNFTPSKLHREVRVLTSRGPVGATMDLPAEGKPEWPGAVSAKFCDRNTALPLRRRQVDAPHGPVNGLAQQGFGRYFNDPEGLRSVQGKRLFNIAGGRATRASVRGNYLTHYAASKAMRSELGWDRVGMLVGNLGTLFRHALTPIVALSCRPRWPNSDQLTVCVALASSQDTANANAVCQHAPSMRHSSNSHGTNVFLRDMTVSVPLADGRSIEARANDGEWIAPAAGRPGGRRHYLGLARYAGGRRNHMPIVSLAMRLTGGETQTFGQEPVAFRRQLAKARARKSPAPDRAACLLTHWTGMLGVAAQCELVYSLLELPLAAADECNGTEPPLGDLLADAQDTEPGELRRFQILLADAAGAAWSSCGRDAVLVSLDCRSPTSTSGAEAAEIAETAATRRMLTKVDNLYSYYGAYASGTYSLISECNQHPHPDCIQRWRAAWCTLQLGRHDNGMVPRGQHDGVEQNAHPKSHDVRIGQDPKNELVDTFVARIRWGAVVVSAGKQRRPRSAPDLAKARAMGRRVAESAAAAATAAVDDTVQGRAVTPPLLWSSWPGAAKRSTGDGELDRDGKRAAALSGMRAEHLKILLADVPALELLAFAATELANADVPADIVTGGRLQKPEPLREGAAPLSFYTDAKVVDSWAPWAFAKGDPGKVIAASADGGMPVRTSWSETSSLSMPSELRQPY
ncbi:hypothetical protein AK812_SmicGene22467 [Symbiodinium microadriaticum]|uniref:Uncharacterized protein n=1 Tax=Symbiodinium microadriaticum TaxID=2951 RepID=A0A1Q9DJS3_SYMMI|nr:hypothetical protein AK812_SmicGene22467 [Symbiodinium microadriaticum]